MMRVYTTAQARDRFATVVNEAAFGAERVILTRHGKNIAALIPISDLDLLNELERLIDVEQARKALAEAKRVGTTALADLKKELDL